MTAPIASRLAAVLLPLAIVLAACSGAGVSPSPAPTGPAATAYPEGSVIVTFRVVDEEFRVLLTDPADVEIARRHAAGEEAPGIPNGKILYGDPGVNVGYSWQLDPNDFEWADVTVEVCDGRPSDVEAREITSDRYCTWAAEVIAVEDAG